VSTGADTTDASGRRAEGASSRSN